MRRRSRTGCVTGHRFRRGWNDWWLVSLPSTASRRPVYNGWRTMRTSWPSGRRSGVSSVAAPIWRPGRTTGLGPVLQPASPALLMAPCAQAVFSRREAQPPRRALACRPVPTWRPRQDRDAVNRSCQRRPRRRWRIGRIAEDLRIFSRTLPWLTSSESADGAPVPRWCTGATGHSFRMRHDQRLAILRASGVVMPICLPRTREEAP